jgi:hypothetical protein
MWEPQPPATLRACTGITLPLPLSFHEVILELHAMGYAALIADK